MSIDIKAKLRNACSKGATRLIRQNNNIPAVVYGNGKESLSIEINGKEFEFLLKKSGLRTKLFNIDIDGKVENAVLVSIQYHPITDKVIHIDFKRIDVNNETSINVPITLINTDISKGVKLGGILNFVNRKILLKGLIKDIPEKIVIDCLNFKIGTTITGSDVELPKNINLGLHQDKLVLVTITGKSKEKEEDLDKTVNATEDKSKTDEKSGKEPNQEAKK